MPGGNVFPDTMNTWIGRELGQGDAGRLSVSAHVMATYAWPLTVYYRGTNSTWLGEADDVVAGFFADRLGRPDFLARWHASGMPLRRWLMNAFCFYLKELRRERIRNRPSGADPAEEVSFDGDPDREVDRAAVVAFVRRAIEETREACRADGLEAHLDLFLRHHVDEIGYAALADEFGTTPERAAVMARTAGRRFERALRQILERDGAAPDGLDVEIRGLIEAAEQPPRPRSR